MFKKSTFLSLLITTALFVSAQTELLNESFGTSAPNIPAGWKAIDNDMENSDSVALAASIGTQFNLNGVGWSNTLTLSNGVNSRQSIWSTSKHINTAAPADDWLISPMITLDTFTRLEFEAASIGTPLSDFEVRISTASDTIPDFLLNPALLTVVGQPANSALDFTEYTLMLDASGYANQNVYLAWRNMGTDDLILVLDDIVVTSVPGFDIALTNVTIPQSTCEYSGTDNIDITIENVGINSWANVDVVAEIDTNGVLFTTLNGTIPGPIDSADEVDFTFPTTVDFNLPGAEFEVRVYVNEAADSEPNNDRDTAILYDVEVSTVPYSNNFDSELSRRGIVTNNVNNDLSIWLAAGGVGVGNSTGYGCLQLDQTTAADDWMFSTCIDLDDTKAYTLSFEEQLFNLAQSLFGVTVAPTADNLSVSIGTSPTIAGMTTTLLTLPGLSNTTAFVEQSTDFTVSSTGTYYIGFHNTSDANFGDFLSIDNFSIEEVAAPVADFSYVANELVVTLTDESTGFITAQSFDPGDGSAAQAAIPALYTYSAPGTYQACLTVSNATGSDTHCESITVDIIGITEIANGSVALYPNPMNDVFTIDAKLARASAMNVQVLDLTGRIILDESYGSSTNQKVSFDVSNLAAGNYFVQIELSDEIVTEKIIITD